MLMELLNQTILYLLDTLHVPFMTSADFTLSYSKHVVSKYARGRIKLLSGTEYCILDLEL